MQVKTTSKEITKDNDQANQQTDNTDLLRLMNWDGVIIPKQTMRYFLLIGVSSPY